MNKKHLILLALIITACNAQPETNRDSSNQNLCVASANLDSVFTEIDISIAQFKSDPNVKRRRHVKVNFELLKSQLKNSKTMSLTLFQNKALNFVIENVEIKSENNIIATGSLIGTNKGSVTLVVNQNSLVGNITNASSDQHFEIRASESDTHSIQEVTHEPEACDPIKAPAPAPGDEIIESDADTLPVIDILAVYTPLAKEAQGGTDQIIALIQLGIADTNKAFNDSGIALSARLVGTLELTANETTDISGDLSALRSNGDGKWDEVHAERSRLGADQVSLIGRYSGSSVGGIGYVSSSRSSAFTITKTTLFRQYTFSHELGHNIGMNHSDGLENPAGGFRTIMAYGTYPRLRRFSNPNRPYNGYATGTASNNSAAIGNANAGKMANLMSAIVPFPESSNPPSESPGSGGSSPPEMPGNGCT